MSSCETCAASLLRCFIFQIMQLLGGLVVSGVGGSLHSRSSLFRGIHGLFQGVFYRPLRSRRSFELHTFVLIRRDMNRAIRQGLDFMNLKVGFVQVHIVRCLRSDVFYIREIALDSPLGFEIVDLDFERYRVQLAANAACIASALLQAEDRIDTNPGDDRHEDQHTSKPGQKLGCEWLAL